MANKYSGADWVKSNFKGREMSQLGERVADLLGDVFFGIYHLENKDIAKSEWDNDYVVLVRISGRDLATVDGDKLTRLVVLSHDRMLRISIRPRSRYGVELMFHQRATRDDSKPLYERMPTMEDHVESIRKCYGNENLEIIA